MLTVLTFHIFFLNGRSWGDRGLAMGMLYVASWPEGVIIADRYPYEEEPSRQKIRLDWISISSPHGGTHSSYIPLRTYLYGMSFLLRRWLAGLRGKEGRGENREERMRTNTLSNLSHHRYRKYQATSAASRPKKKKCADPCQEGINDQSIKLCGVGDRCELPVASVM